MQLDEANGLESLTAIAIKRQIMQNMPELNTASLKAFIALIPASMLLFGSAVLFLKGKTVSSVLQLLGAACLLVVVLCHLCEAFQLLPSMHFGREHSVGHYLDFWSAVLGLSLFPIGYLLNALTNRRAP